MDRFIYTAARGATQTLQSQAVRANNLANANTTGFKADLERVQTFAIKGNPAELSSRWLPQLASGGFSHAQGSIKMTNRALDVAITGIGMFALQIKQAGAEVEAYSRNGSMTTNAAGKLMVDGHTVLGTNGPIVLPSYDKLEINRQGQINILPAGGNAMVTVGQLKLVAPSKNALIKADDGLFYTKNKASLDASNQVTVEAGALEDSNVNTVQELVASMDLNRQFEMQVKLMSCADKLASAGNSLLQNS